MAPDKWITRVLYVDLSGKSSRVEERLDLFSRGVGGAGVASELLLEECPEGIDPLDPRNPVILAVGPLTGMFPLASKTVAAFKSPLTGNLGESHCGGRTASAIRSAGYGAIVIKGAAAKPVWLSIHGDKVSFKDARAAWGMRSGATSARVIRMNEPGAGMRTILRIGRAGERLVSYSCVTAETYRHFGRLGLGAVFGSKKLKAVVVSGSLSMPMENGKEFREVYDEIYEAAVKSEAMKKYHDLGTAGNVLALNELKGFPTRNLAAASFDMAAGLSGERLAENFLGRRLACSHCPVGCVHVAALREPYRNEPYFYKTSMISYDYEMIYSLGSMLGIGEGAEFLRLLDKVETLGLDVMSAGVCLAWATEALERGIVGERETVVPLKWGDREAYAKAAQMIVEQPNDFYARLARGVEKCAAAYGGSEFALAFGGNEMPGYHTGPASHLNYLIGARHSHLDSGGYGVDQKAMGKEYPSPERLAESLIEEERWRQVLSSLVICFFARGIYKEDLVLKALRIAGYELSSSDLARIGERIHKLKYRFKNREGFSLNNIKAPERIFETPSPLGTVDRDYMQKAIARAREILET